MRPIICKMDEISFFWIMITKRADDFHSSSMLSYNLSGAFMKRRKQVSQIHILVLKGTPGFISSKDPSPLNVANLFLMIQDLNFLSGQ